MGLFAFRDEGFFKHYLVHDHIDIGAVEPGKSDGFLLSALQWPLLWS